MKRKLEVIEEPILDLYLKDYPDDEKAKLKSFIFIR